MLQGLFNALRIADLRRRVLFTALMLVLFRLGTHLPVPGVDPAALERLFSQQGSVFNLMVPARRLQFESLGAAQAL